jgi:hypothetical protein
MRWDVSSLPQRRVRSHGSHSLLGPSAANALSTSEFAEAAKSRRMDGYPQTVGFILADECSWCLSGRSSDPEASARSTAGRWRSLHMCFAVRDGFAVANTPVFHHQHAEHAKDWVGEARGGGAGGFNSAGGQLLVDLHRWPEWVTTGQRSPKSRWDSANFIENQAGGHLLLYGFSQPNSQPRHLTW